MSDSLPPTHDRAPGLFGWLFGRARRPPRKPPKPSAAPARRRPRRPVGTTSLGWDADRQVLRAVLTLAAGGVGDLEPLWRELRRELDAERIGRHLPPEAWNGFETVLTVVVPDDVDGDALRVWIAGVERDPVARIAATEVSLVTRSG